MEFVRNQVEQVQTMNHVIDVMRQRLHVFQESGDHRAVFQRAYLLMTQEMQRRLVSGFFHDTVWMERVLGGMVYSNPCCKDPY
ncbi:DUF5995 family protein [Paenibacillus aestuarii]|uniref:DUF5995 family protein n=1 Tax=Paenibacillus aestuarii TaxID=516965 RepID=A0ABW0KGE3_9BACL|nr:DUF5995 family protein [Paenibacillus aestuarii]